MEENQTPTSPIAGEPALLKALEMIDEIIDQHLNPHLWVFDESTKVDDLKDLRATMQDAKDAMRSEAEERHDDGHDADAERTLDGEMEAERRAERMADAAHEIACELWTLDPYDGWD